MRQGIAGSTCGVTSACSRRALRRALRMAVDARTWHGRPQYFGFLAFGETVNFRPQTSHCTGGGGPSCQAIAGHAVRRPASRQARSWTHRPPDCSGVQ